MKTTLFVVLQVASQNQPLSAIIGLLVWALIIFLIVRFIMKKSKGKTLSKGKTKKVSKKPLVVIIIVVACAIFYFTVGDGRQIGSLIGELRADLKAHPEVNLTKLIFTTPSLLIALIIILGFWCVIIFLILRYFKRLITGIKDDGISKPLPDKVSKDLANPYTLRIRTQGEDLLVNNPFRGILCIGSAGSGKSESVFRQLLESAVEKDFCGIQYDFKYPTLTNELEGYLSKKEGRFKHFTINFEDLHRTNRVNPLDPRYILNASYAREYSTSIINNLLPESLEKKDFWVRSCTDVLTAVIFYLAKEMPEYSTLPHAVALILTDEKKIINLLSSNLQCLGMVKSLETALNNDSKEQLSGVVSTLQSAISVLNTPEIFYVLSGNDFSLEVNNPSEPIWLSLGNSPTIHETYSPVLSLIATVALKQMNQQGKHHSAVLLDEAPTLYIPKLEIIPATARSNKVSISFFAQDISQIVAQYGQKNADVIISLLNNQFFGRVSSQKTAEYVSKLFGKTDQYFESYTESKGSTSNVGLGFSKGSNSGRSTSLTVQERERIKPQEILQFDVGQFCGVLVEGKNKEFNTRFKNPICETISLPSKSFIFDIDVNFATIHEQIKTLLNHEN